MTAHHLIRHGEGSWLVRFKETLARLFSKATTKAKTKSYLAMDRPIVTEDMVDQASEDSFPASDPPSYTGTST